VIVVDASALVLAVTEDSARGETVLLALGDGAIAPWIIDAEVGQALRGMVLRHDLDAEGGWMALTLAQQLIGERGSEAAQLRRAWELRDNVSFYDALYVALAELRRLTLVTADRRLAAANGPRCRIEVV